jgi:DNA-directed RNA polymerase specialized sigma24 family protein
MNDRGVNELDPVSDHHLAERVRNGDRLTFGILYERHHRAAWGIACVATAFCPDAEVALIEGFARACADLPVSLAPDFDLRRHLLAGVRRTATDRLARSEPLDGRDGEYRSPVQLALRSLPEDWRSALWLTEVEGMNPAEVSAVVGLDPAAVIPLRSVTWEMVRAAWVEEQLRIEAPARCRPAIDLLGPYLRGELSAREQIMVKGHFATCQDCATRRRQLADPRTRLQDAVLAAPDLGLETADRWLALTRPRLGSGTGPEVQPERAGEAPRIPGTDSIRRIWLDPLASSTPAARRFAAWALVNWGVTEMLDVVQLLTSELVTNAVVHDRSPLELVLHRRPDALHVEIRGATTPRAASTLNAGADPGHCLLLLEAMADAWGAAEDAGKVVWFEIAHSDAEHRMSESGPGQVVDLALAG